MVGIHYTNECLPKNNLGGMLCYHLKELNKPSVVNPITVIADMQTPSIAASIMLYSIIVAPQ
jgi:hypothetical protein